MKTVNPSANIQELQAGILKYKKPKKQSMKNLEGKRTINNMWIPFGGSMSAETRILIVTWHGKGGMNN